MVGGKDMEMHVMQILQKEVSQPVESTSAWLARTSAEVW
jgi:hypothetical protein